MTVAESPVSNVENRAFAPDLFGKLSRTAKTPLHALARWAARAYIAGSELANAVAVARRLAEENLASTLGFWDGPGDSPESVFNRYAAAIEGLAASQLDSYVSIKLPALGYSDQLLGELVLRASDLGVRLHFDALGPETVDPTWRAIEAAKSAAGEISCTLPARWLRSPEDADWAVAHGLDVRIVKGQWPDPAAPKLDPRAAYQRIVERLAGRARSVAVASHDLPTARRAIERLKAAGTPTTLELLYGLPTRRQIALGRELGVPVRIYVPYGKAYLPYCLAQLKRNPLLAWWLVRDAIRG